MVTGKSQPGLEPVQLPATSPEPIPSSSPPSKRDLASWWRNFKRNSTRKDEIKGMLASEGASPSAHLGWQGRREPRAARSTEFQIDYGERERARIATVGCDYATSREHVFPTSEFPSADRPADSASQQNNLEAFSVYR